MPMPMHQTSIYLASKSPRRRELLTQIGVSFELLAVTVDETRPEEENPEAYVARVALAKARTGQASLEGKPPRPVLGADTVVVIDAMILGKPRNRDEGLAMLSKLSGREHRVLSAVALTAGLREAIKLQESHVRFRQLGSAELLAYWDTGEPSDKAGSYAIQGRAAAFISEIKGSYSGVMGLPLFETSELLRAFHITVL
jgi:septum formation protein